MDELLKRIKRAVMAKNYRLTLKAELEMYADDLDESDIIESILCSERIHKTIRSRSRQSREYLHIIISPTFSGTLLYTKGKLVLENGIDVYYVFVSAKQAT